LSPILLPGRWFLVKLFAAGHGFRFGGKGFDVAEERHTKAFVVGTLLGGIAGAAAALWRVPRSGAETRATLNAKVEETIFHLLGMDERETAPTTPAPIVRTSLPTQPDAVATEPEPEPEAPALPVDEPPAVPATFRGEPVANTKPEYQR
jgi:hypothetical protein